jgi:hypothetical protein
VRSILIANAIQRDARELRPLTWDNYKRTAKRVCDKFGRSRQVDDLRPEDFESLKAVFTRTMDLVAIGNEVNRARVIFKHGYDAGLMLAPMRFGPLFKRASHKVLRIERAKRPKKIFTAGEVKALMEVATPQLKAMILLGLL